ncbi:hypothetical protein SAY86_016017 [Trapa natans]|uniref:Uncharacterized protein n=1 Tax=Trapa natans TaxID=22666 RepID=A0AAN7LIW0_TRANT|nr:hypothetical protein SAY86_016017 [Trapa natans]
MRIMKGTMKAEIIEAEIMMVGTTEVEIMRAETIEAEIMRVETMEVEIMRVEIIEVELISQETIKKGTIKIQTIKVSIPTKVGEVEEGDGATVALDMKGDMKGEEAEEAGAIAMAEEGWEAT